MNTHEYTHTRTHTHPIQQLKKPHTHEHAHNHKMNVLFVRPAVEIVMQQSGVNLSGGFSLACLAFTTKKRYHVSIFAPDKCTRPLAFRV